MYSELATPLTDLTKKESKFRWTINHQVAFETLKHKITEAPVLAPPNLSLPFRLTTDASEVGVGAVLTQIDNQGIERPVAFYSRKLNPTERRYSATDREALAVVLSCRNFHHFLWGTEFQVYTDHQPLTNVFKRKTRSPRMSRWMLEIRE